jgi:hypothetical protein
LGFIRLIRKGVRNTRFRICVAGIVSARQRRPTYRN